MTDSRSQYESLPIPTYEEATSSRPGSSSSHLGPQESGDDAERQGLLGREETAGHAGPRVRYQQPTVESARSSLDFLTSSNESSERGSTDNLRNELEQMEVEDPAAEPQSSFSKRLTTFTRTLSSIHLPLRKYLPSFNFKFDWIRFPSTNLDQYKCILVLRVVAVVILGMIIYLLVASNVFGFGAKFNMSQIYEPESVRIFVQSRINETNISDNLRVLSKFPHLAGTEGNYVLAEWMEQQFSDAGLEDVAKEKFDVYLNYPRKDGRRVAIVDPPEKAWEAKLEEEQAYSGPPREQAAVFHGHSKSGNVTGPLIYANYGSRDDFKSLADMGVDLHGSIVLVRYYGSPGGSALKVKAAELAGAAGCLVYSDPAEDGFVKGKPWPDGRYMPSDGVHRDTVSLKSWVVGDVLTPGFASLEAENNRLPLDESEGLNKIPSLPLAWRDAQPLLQALEGHGKKVPDKWVGGVPEITEWWSGDSSSPKVNLLNIQDEEERQPIYNVLARIKGAEQTEKRIIVGSHRDAWCFGAAHPGSGSAILLEVARVFGHLRSLGWRPLRTIEFASWDGEGYNLIGSTEHVENDVDILRGHGFAYINLDNAVSGEKFRASGSPVFAPALLRILKRTSDPKSNESLRTIWDREGSKFDILGADSGYVAFQDIAGMASIDMGFEGERFPDHSCYDSFEWMDTVGDQEFSYHRVLGQVLGLLLLELASEPILPFDMVGYAGDVTDYVDKLEDYAKEQGAPLVKPSPRDTEGLSEAALNFAPLRDAAGAFRTEAKIFHKWDNYWNSSLYASGGFENNVMAVKRISHNSHVAYFDTNLLDIEDGGGIPNRTQFKHVIHGPQAWARHEAAPFPAIRDAIDSGNWTETQRWINRVAEVLAFASSKLNH